MLRPLQQTTKDGTPYCRPEAVDTEIRSLVSVSPAELERRAALWPSTVDEYVSSEALVYFVRTLPEGAHRQKLCMQLMTRVAKLASKTPNVGCHYDDINVMSVRDEVTDRFTDLLLSDWKVYDRRLDYYEIRFNQAVAKDRYDASSRIMKYVNRTEELAVPEDGLHDRMEAASENCTPFDMDDLSSKDYRLRLEEAIDSLPELERRIVVMWRQETPIESKNPLVASMCKVLGKSEKTIRTRRDNAFALLRQCLESEGRKM